MLLGRPLTVIAVQAPSAASSRSYGPGPESSPSSSAGRSATIWCGPIVMICRRGHRCCDAGLAEHGVQRLGAPPGARDRVGERVGRVLEPDAVDEERRRRKDVAVPAGDLLRVHRRPVRAAVQIAFEGRRVEADVARRRDRSGATVRPWFSNRRSCISQNFPCAAAISAASAAGSASGKRWLRGFARKTNRTSGMRASSSLMFA